MKRLFILELKQIWKRLLLIAFILTCMYAVALTMVSLGIHGTSQINAVIDKVYNSSLILNFGNIQEMPFSDVEKFSLKNMIYEIEQENKIKLDTYFITSQGKKISIKDMSLKFIELSDTILSSDRSTFYPVEDFICSGRGWNENSSRNGIWIHERKGKEFGIQVGDTLQYMITEDISILLTVEGIFTEELRKNSIYLSDSIMSIETGNYIALQKNIKISYQAKGQLAQLSQYPSLYDNCNKKGIYISGINSAEQLLYMSKTVQFVCIGLAGTLMVCALVASYILFRLILTTRIKFIALCKTVGISEQQLIKVYFASMEGILIFSFSSAFLVSKQLNRKIAAELCFLLQIDYFELFLSITEIGFLFLLAQLFLLLWYVWMKKNIQKINNVIQFHKE